MGDTIAALATAPGRSGVGIVRLSGPHALEIAQGLCGFSLKPRYAHFVCFRDQKNTLIDQGLALYFPAPHSFTGETVVELQSHGSPVILDWLLSEVCARGARLAKPGEFSERAFLNDKMDLAQAEAVADLIAANSRQAVMAASRSLVGDFSFQINELIENTTTLRVFVEAAMDFPDEEIDFLSDHQISTGLETLRTRLAQILKTSKQGVLLREGMRVVIVGEPNAGKSTLLNALAGEERAIVTEVPGTTRDLLEITLNLGGLTLHVTDTAGLRDSHDVVEKEGIRRARAAIQQADLVLLLVDLQSAARLELVTLEDWKAWIHQLLPEVVSTHPLLVVGNKMDLLPPSFLLSFFETEGGPSSSHPPHDATLSFLKISAKQRQGLDQLTQRLHQIAGYHSEETSGWIARQRHVRALKDALLHCDHAKEFLRQKRAELLAEELKLVHNALGEITGFVSSDELLGKIFSSFCIGK